MFAFSYVMFIIYKFVIYCKLLTMLILTLAFCIEDNSNALAIQESFCQSKSLA